MRRGLLRVGSIVLFLAAVAFGWLAFTRFDDAEPPQPGSPGFRDYEDERMRDAQLSAALGLGAAVALASAFACHELAGRSRSEPPQP